MASSFFAIFVGILFSFIGLFLAEFSVLSPVGIILIILGGLELKNKT